MASHNLLLNEQKTEVVVIAAPNRSRVHSNVTVAVSIDVCGVCVMPKPSIRDIGVVIDDTMSMAVHVSRVCQVTYCQIRCIAKIRKCLTTAACKTIVHALVMSRVDYGNALLFGLPEMKKKKNDLFPTTTTISHKLYKFELYIQLEKEVNKRC